MERLRFWFNFDRPFWVWHSQGEMIRHIKATRYSILFDEVEIRTGSGGYVEDGERWVPRRQYEHMIAGYTQEK